MRQWNGKTAYITGGSSGIGFALAEELVSLGASVLLIARNAEKLSKAKEDLLSCGKKAAGDRPALNTDAALRINTLSLDISNAEETEKLLKAAIRDYGPPDILMNCAGIAYPQYFQDIPLSVFNSIIDINIKGTWNVLQAVVPAMTARGSGTIVTISSVAGFLGVFGYTAYSASKFALFGMMEALRGELKPKGVSVHVVCPSDTDTPQLAEEDKTKPPETRAISGNTKVLSPSFVARSIIKASGGKSFVIIPGISGKFIYRISRLFPALVRFIMDKDAEKVRNIKKS